MYATDGISAVNDTADTVRRRKACQSDVVAKVYYVDALIPVTSALWATLSSCALRRHGLSHHGTHI